MAKIQFPCHIVQALEEFASSNDFRKPKFEFLEGSNNGFIGLIKRCKIIEDERKLSVICKFLPDNKEKNEKYHAVELFRREIFAYEKFLPQLVEIQLENGFKYRDGEGFWSFPVCYKSKFDEENPEKSFIIMEDLGENGYVVESMFDFMGSDYTRRLFTELGKFHAISFALRKKNSEVFDEFKSLNDLMCQLMTTDSMKNLAPRNCQLASELFEASSEKLVKEKILACKNDLWLQVENLLKPNEAEPHGIVCHGDCWINNIMINYTDKEKKTIKNICLVDWQQTRYGSGASELMYFLFCCTSKSMRDQHKDELFDIYYESLGKMSRVFRINIEEDYPREKFDEQLRKFGKFAFAMALFGVTIDSKYPEILFEDRNTALSEEEEKAVLRYSTRMKDVVNDLVKMNAF